MSDRPSTPDVLAELGRAPIPVEEPDVTEARRGRVVSQLARSIRESKATRERARRQRIAVSVLAVAALLALFIGGLWRGAGTPHTESVASVRASSSGVLVTHGAESSVAQVNTELSLASGDGVSTVADAHAALRLASGAEVKISASTRVTLSAATAGDEQLELSTGEIAVQVPHLGEHGSFRVQTPDLRVVVHGTAFVVRVSKRSEGVGTLTEVTVTEGKVSVERQGATRFLTKGQSFRSDADESKSTKNDVAPRPTAEAAPPSADTSPSAEAAGKTTAPVKPASPVTAPTKAAINDPSALAEQNRLFGAAAAARRKGDDATALGHLNQLLSRYPNSPLAPEARVERFRALARSGKQSEAAQEARRYLLEHRGGAAEEEARGVALTPGGSSKPK
ncbi:MAG: FecR domain-containing protein [Myxococcales bacterium]|nr:FecR domain-containing protein [Myxococcales bacterium]